MGGTMTTDERSMVMTSGWVMFAATLATVAALFNLIYGLVLLIKDEWVVLSAEEILVFDLTAWGWMLLVLAAVQLFVAYGIANGSIWARIAGVIWASVIALGQMAFLSVYPLWSLVIIALCVLVIYGLTVHGDEVI